MEIDYKKIINFILVSGKRLAIRAGNIADIGITKTDLTEEDLAIENGLKDIISSFGDDHILYAEEENDLFKSSENLWVADPISGTRGFIEGRPNSYSIVVAHLVKNKTVFAAVYNPTSDELFTAYEGKGAFLNGKKIVVSQGQDKVYLRPSSAWAKLDIIERIKVVLKNYTIDNNWNSLALNYCDLACGRVDAVITATKDAFPEFAGGFIVQEAGGVFTNIQGDSQILSTDRIFIGANKKFYNLLFSDIKEVVE